MCLKSGALNVTLHAFGKRTKKIMRQIYLCMDKFHNSYPTKSPWQTRTIRQKKKNERPAAKSRTITETVYIRTQATATNCRQYVCRENRKRIEERKHRKSVRFRRTTNKYVVAFFPFAVSFSWNTWNCWRYLTVDGVTIFIWMIRLEISGYFHSNTFFSFSISDRSVFSRCRLRRCVVLETFDV